MSEDELSVTIELPFLMHDALQRLAEKTGNSVESIIRTAIAKELEEWEAMEWRPSPYAWPSRGYYHPEWMKP